MQGRFFTGFIRPCIYDFDADGRYGQDLLDISGLGVTAENFATRVKVLDLGRDTLITIDNEDTILLRDVDGRGANVITQQDFILG